MKISRTSTGYTRCDSDGAVLGRFANGRMAPQPRSSGLATHRIFGAWPRLSSCGERIDFGGSHKKVLHNHGRFLLVMDGVSRRDEACRSASQVAQPTYMRRQYRNKSATLELNLNRAGKKQLRASRAYGESKTLLFWARPRGNKKKPGLSTSANKSEKKKKTLLDLGVFPFSVQTHPGKARRGKERFLSDSILEPARSAGGGRHAASGMG